MLHVRTCTLVQQNDFSLQRPMTQFISCNYARVAVRWFTKECMTKRNRLPNGGMKLIFQKYNQHFENCESLQLTYNVAEQCFPRANRLFNLRWHPTVARHEFTNTFSTTAWNQLSQSEQHQHSVFSCRACEEHPLTPTLPISSAKKRKSTSISFTEKDLSCSSQFGRKALKELNAICKESFKKSVQDVITETPKSNLVRKTSSTERLQQKRQMEKQIRDTIQKEYNENGDSIVLQNRVSWQAFDKIRKTEGLTPTHKRSLGDASAPPAKHKRHGMTADSLQIDKEQLLVEANTWSPDQTINWSEIGSKYGLTTPNRGQIIKEFLSQHNVPAALATQRTARAPRRAKKRLAGGRTSFPMYRPVPHYRQRMRAQIENGNIRVGEEVVKSKYTRYTVDKSSHTLVAEGVEVSARKIPLLEIRQTLLKKHEEMKLIRNQSDEYFENLSAEQIEQRLRELHHTISAEKSTNDLRQELKLISRQRHFKMWHDHATIGGHGHFLVLVAPIFDPAFYYTSGEVQSLYGADIDVPSLIERPEVHILAQSRSSAGDQAMFNETRRECTLELRTKLKTEAGHAVNDGLRFFHADGPAAQFEAGNKQGGHFCCVQCGADSDRFDDISYCYHAPTRTLAERQEFVLQGEAWKNHTGQLNNSYTVDREMFGRKFPDLR